MAMTLDGSNGVTFNDASLQGAAASPFGLKNRIINGDMRIDQRNAGASVATTTANAGVYTLDRWFYYASQTSKYTVQQNAAAVTPPAGFTNYLGVTIAGSTYTPTTAEEFGISQVIEGFNISDLGWGTANAQTVTLSFWVRSSVTGTFGGSLRQGSGTRSYPFTYTISSANTWEKKSISITGETTGTWNSTNGSGIILGFQIGAGATASGTPFVWASANTVGATGALNLMATANATLYITGVQLEVGTTATPFERRLYNHELANCQRYYQKTVDIAFRIQSQAGTGSRIPSFFKVTMRATPTVVLSGSGMSNTSTYGISPDQFSINNTDVNPDIYMTYTATSEL